MFLLLGVGTRTSKTIASSILVIIIFLTSFPHSSAAALAARLKALGVESIMADRNGEPGDNWARRYDSMRFHVPTSFCEMPYMCKKSFDSSHALFIVE